MPARSGSTAPRSATSCAPKWAASASPPRTPKCSSPPTRRGPCPNGWCSARSSASSCSSRVMSWLNSRSLEQPDEASNATIAQRRRPALRRRSSSPHTGRCRPRRAGRARPRPRRCGSRSATRAARRCSRACSSRGRPTRCPPTATAPVLKTGKPEALQINVGNQVAPPVGPPAKTVTDVSLLAARPDEGARERRRLLRRRSTCRSTLPCAAPPRCARLRRHRARAAETPPTTNTGE